MSQLGLLTFGALVGAGTCLMILSFWLTFGSAHALERWRTAVGTAGLCALVLGIVLLFVSEPGKCPDWADTTTKWWHTTRKLWPW